MIDINLAIPHVQFVPSLDELQQVLNKAARYIVETGKSITAWGQHRIHLVTKLNEYGDETEVVEDIPSENLQNWYPVIQSNKGRASHNISNTVTSAAAFNCFISYSCISF